MEFSQEDLQKLKESIAGEIVLAHDVSSAFKKWRNIFEIGQKKLAMELNLKVSTISDYENGRRQNPGANFVKKYVDALINIDLNRKGHIVKSLITKQEQLPFEIREFKKIIKPSKLFKIIDLYDVNLKKLGENIYGITYIDSFKIKDFDLSKYPLIYGKTNKRLLFFSKTTDLLIVEYTLKILKYLTNQYPLALIIEDENPEQNAENYKTLKYNFPIFLVKNTKEELLELIRF